MNVKNIEKINNYETRLRKIYGIALKTFRHRRGWRRVGFRGHRPGGRSNTLAQGY